MIPAHIEHVFKALDQRDPSSTGGQHGRKSAQSGAQNELPAEDSTHDDAGTAGVVSSEAPMSSFRQFVAETFLPTFAPTKPRDVRSMVELHLGKPIVTTHVYPPIPCRKFDWCAYPDGEEEDGNYGWGKTEADAIADLIEILRDDERIPETL